MGFEPMIYCLQDSRIKPDYTNQPNKTKKRENKGKKIKELHYNPDHRNSS